MQKLTIALVALFFGVKAFEDNFFRQELAEVGTKGENCGVFI